MMHPEKDFSATGQGNFSICRAKFSFRTETADLLYTYIQLIYFDINFGFFVGKKEEKN